MSEIAPRYRLTMPPPALERQEQAALFRLAENRARRDPRWSLLNASLNGLPTTIPQAVLAKKCGMKKGYPDLFLPVAARGYHGLFIELKRKDGTPSDVTLEQRAWLDRLSVQGYRASVAFGWEDAANQITAYLDKP